MLRCTLRGARRAATPPAAGAAAMSARLRRRGPPDNAVHPWRRSPRLRAEKSSLRISGVTIGWFCTRSSALSRFFCSLVTSVL